MAQPKSTDSSSEQKSRRGIFFSVIMTILILAIIIVIALINNKSLLNSAINIPFVNHLLPSAQVKDSQIPQKNSNQKVAKQKSVDQKAKDQTNTTKLNNQQAQNNTSQQSTSNLSLKDNSQQIQQQQQQQPSNKHIIEATAVAKAYTSMPPSKAASILDKLSTEEVVYAMTEMSGDDRSTILSKMDPNKAADLTLLLKPKSIVTDSDIAQLQQKVNVIENNKIKNQSVDSLLDTYSKIPPDQAAKLIDRLMNANSQKTLTLLKKMDSNLRAQILTAMSSDPNMISTATTISQNLLQ